MKIVGTMTNRKTVLPGWFWAALAFGLAARLVLAAAVPPANDINAWQQFSAYWQEGRSPYDASHRFNYSPVWFWIITVVSTAARKTGCPFPFAIRLPMILADAAICWLILRSAARMKAFGPERAAVPAALFILNPVSIVISGVYGQFDNISLLFALAAWYRREFGAAGRAVRSALDLAISVAVKHFTVMLAPVFAFAERGAARRAAVLLAAPSLFILTLLLYIPGSGAHIVRGVFRYNLHAGYWGWSGIICRVWLFATHVDLVRMPWFRLLDYFNWFLYAGILLASARLVRTFDLLDSILAVFLIFYAFTTQIAPQYTIWIIPFAALRPSRCFYAYSAAGGLQTAAFYYAHWHWFTKTPFTGALSALVPPAFIVFRHLTWLVAVIWLLALLGVFRRFRTGHRPAV